MLKKITIILIPIFVLFLSFKTAPKTSNLPGLPVFLAYKNSTPDSIKTFFKIYLKSKKVRVVDQNELTQLVAVEINSAAEEFYRNPTKNAEKFIGDRLDPVGNILALQIYNTWGMDSSYLIDSIKWKINYVPAKDTIPATRRMFINPDRSQEKLYITLKLFIDEVLSSGYLK